MAGLAFTMYPPRCEFQDSKKRRWNAKKLAMVLGMLYLDGLLL
jgi:hypothetical protein